jgi:beta-lactamase regulating signal transducer with metallopeptidase domain
MPEHIAQSLYYLQVHLMFASLVWFAAWILTSIPRGSATAKYWIWLATWLNFVLPLGAVLDRFLAPHLSWATPLHVVANVGISRSAPVATVLGVAWLLGASLMFTRLCLRIRADRRDSQETGGQTAVHAREGLLALGIPVRFAGTRHAPAVDGILHPHILLPNGIDRLLSEHELDAVLIHEVTHARRRDNLIRLVYEVGLCGLWFHPLVWITGHRIALYRELSCDESVIQSAHGADLVSALAKLANPGEDFLLQAAASSFISHRLARLTATQPQRKCLAANTLLVAVFGGALLAGVLATVAHTACCFVAR